jgi:hypothetical protein
MISLTDSTISSFWDQVALPNETGCLLWTGSRNSNGYGRLSIRGRWVGAHRISLILADGPPADKTLEAAHAPVICHRRDCVAALHLRWATRKEQSEDKRRDGTSLNGEQHGQAKLTAAQVREIRTRYAAGGVTQQELGEEYGVLQASISKIVLRKKWRSQ